MAITAQLHDGRTLEFPDGTDPSVVQATVKKVLGVAPVAEAQPRKGVDSFSNTGGGAAVGNPLMRGRLGAPTGQPETDIPYEMGGKATDFLKSIGLPDQVAAAGGTAVNVGMVAAPMLMGGGIGGSAGKAVAPVLERGAQSMMQKALKPTLRALESGDAAKASKTILNTPGMYVNANGVETLDKGVSALNQKVAQAILDSKATIDPNTVASHADSLLTKGEFVMQPNADAELSAIEKVKQAFLNHAKTPKVTPARVIPEKTIESAVLDASGKPFSQTIPGKTIPASGTDQIPVQMAQEMKQAGYKRIADKYSPVNPEDASTAGEKAILRGLREEIAKAVPEVAPLNARESALINARDIMERRVLMAGNNDVMGIAGLVHSPIRFAAQMADRSILAKSMLARLLHSQSGVAPIEGKAAGSSAAMIDAILNQRGQAKE